MRDKVPSPNDGARDAQLNREVVMDAATAKRQSEAWIATVGAPINTGLPQLEEPAELEPRAPRDVAIRAWVLTHIVYLGYGNSGTEMLDLLKKARLDSFLSGRETNLCVSSKFTDQQKAWAAWHCEAVHGCAWALGMVDTQPLDPCPDTLASMFPLNTDPWPSIERATLREYDQIYARADTMYRLHWAAVESRFGGEPLSQPEPAVLMRRHSLEWVAGSPHEWDDVPLDT